MARSAGQLTTPLPETADLGAPLVPMGERVFLATNALLFLASAAGTIAWCGSMSVGGMPMPGGWTMSMAWMRMPGQRLARRGRFVHRHVGRDDGGDDAAVAVPMLWRYRRTLRGPGERASVALTALVGDGLLPRVDCVRGGRISARRRVGRRRDAAGRPSLGPCRPRPAPSSCWRDVSSSACGRPATSTAVGTFQRAAGRWRPARWARCAPGNGWVGSAPCAARASWSCCSSAGSWTSA